MSLTDAAGDRERGTGDDSICVPGSGASCGARANDGASCALAGAKDLAKYVDEEKIKALTANGTQKGAAPHACCLTIVGEVREPPACPCRRRGKTVCARGAWAGLLGGLNFTVARATACD
jgi:hypothetical protein